jgi:hypothetical protein
LHTARLALEIATDLGASYLINNGLDRNVVDLNRLSQIRDKAPWFLEILESLLAEILTKHERAEILVIHGWNVVQAKCDFGVGAHLADDDAPSALITETRTVSAAYVRQRLQPLRVGLLRRGIHSALGERYPARHPNNLLQLFRRGGGADREAPPRLRHWATSGRIEAVQWELGIPLRWPGPQRERLRAVVRQSLSANASAIDSTTLARVDPTALLAPSATLRFFDARAGLGMLAAVDPAPPPRHGAQGRVLLFLDHGRIALFTGDDRGRDNFANEGPRFRLERGGDLRFGFRGSILETDDGLRYLDLEHALSRSHLRRLEANLLLTPSGAGVGRVRGTVTLDDRHWQIDTHGFADPRAWRHWSGSRRSEWTVHAVFADGSALIAHSGGRRLLDRPAGATATHLPLHAVRIALARDRYTPRQLALHFGDGACLRLDPVGHLAVFRPVARGRNARATLGVARARVDGRGELGTALYEYTRLYDAD